MDVPEAEAKVRWLKVFVRVSLWGVKGALLLVGLLAVWLWAGDRFGPRSFRLAHWTVGPDRIDGFGVYGGWHHRRVGVAGFWETYPEGWNATRPVTNGRRFANRDGLGWSWVVADPTTDSLNWSNGKMAHTWGWFEVGSASWSHPGNAIACDYRMFACIGAVAAVWPVVSLLRLARRCRRVVAGCCRGCGYDLRATPERCPECGMTSGRDVGGRVRVVRRRGW